MREVFHCFVLLTPFSLHHIFKEPYERTAIVMVVGLREANADIRSPRRV
jgi:hypothetical protein